MVEYREVTDERAWDELIEAHAGHPMQAWGWGELKARTGSWSARRIVVERDGAFAGAAQVLVRKLPWPFGHICYAPRGPVADRVEDVPQVADDIAAWCKANVSAVSLKIDPRHRPGRGRARPRLAAVRADRAAPHRGDRPRAHGGRDHGRPPFQEGAPVHPQGGPLRRDRAPCDRGGPRRDHGHLPPHGGHGRLRPPLRRVLPHGVRCVRRREPGVPRRDRGAAARLPVEHRHLGHGLRALGRRDGRGEAPARELPAQMAGHLHREGVGQRALRPERPCSRAA